jgi:spore maturation protein CgeB
MDEFPCITTNLLKISNTWFTDPSDRAICVIYDKESRNIARVLPLCTIKGQCVKISFDWCTCRLYVPEMKLEKLMKQKNLTPESAVNWQIWRKATENR